MIKAITFDYGGVIKLSENDLIGDICNYLNVDRASFQEEYFKVNHLANVDNKSFSHIFVLVASKFNDSEKTKKGVLNIIEKNKDKSHLNDELIKIIKFLKNREYKIALLSNNSIDLKERLLKDKIIDLFDNIVISAEVGCQKPQPEIFNILFKELGLKPNEVVFIDDTPRSLEGADKIGYTPILFKDNKTFKKDLSNILKIELI